MERWNIVPLWKRKSLCKSNK